jgi:hypothetical protein
VVEAGRTISLLLFFEFPIGLSKQADLDKHLCEPSRRFQIPIEDTKSWK